MAEPRLHLDEPLASGAQYDLPADQARQLTQVLRLRAGAALRLFNRRDGEWRGRLGQPDRRRLVVLIEECLRSPAILPGPVLALAPIRPARLDWVVEKVVELGVSRIDLVITERTIVRPERADRLRGVVREAAEQCERLDLPMIGDPQPLGSWLAAGTGSRSLLLADEAGGEAPLPLLVAPEPPVLLVGPEGGFSPAERGLIKGFGARSISLGPSILRAETASMALLAAWRLLCQGDMPPRS